MRYCKIIATYFGIRRDYPFKVEQTMELLETVIENEKALDPGIDELDTIIINHDFGNDKSRKFIDSLNGIKTHSGKVIAINRDWEDGIGMSFKSFNYAYEKFKDNYDYWFFTEDDYLMVLDKYYIKFINQLDNDPRVAYVGGYREPSTIYDENGYIEKTGGYDPHCHGGNGLTHINYLEKAYIFNKHLPYSDKPMPLIMTQNILNSTLLKSTSIDTADWYRRNELEGEVRFTNVYIKLGYKLQELITEDNVIFSAQRQIYY